MSSKSVSPHFCLPVIDDIMPDTPPQDIGGIATNAFRLPDSFPAEILDDDQLAAIASWFDTWCGDLLHTLRIALLDHPHPGGQRQGVTPPSLEQFERHAAILAHLLRLHPATEPGIPKLAARLGISRRAAYYIRDTVLRHIRPALAGTISRRTAHKSLLTDLRENKTLDLARATTPDAGTIIIPFRRRVHLSGRFATVKRIALHPAVGSVRESETPTGAPAITIKLKH